jgi:high-affinity Fe2+/Pb2+ permease
MILAISLFDVGSSGIARVPLMTYALTTSSTDLASLTAKLKNKVSTGISCVKSSLAVIATGFVLIYASGFGTLLGFVGYYTSETLSSVLSSYR